MEKKKKKTTDLVPLERNKMKHSLWEFRKVQKGNQIQEAVGILHNEVFYIQKLPFF